MQREHGEIINRKHLADRLYSGLIGALRKNHEQVFNVAGLPDAMKTWLAWFTANALDRKPCLIVPDELRARTAAADLAALTDQPVLVFRARELNLEDADAVSHESEQQRIALLSRLLSGDFAALILPASAILQKLPSPDRLRQHMISCHLGAVIDPDQLVDRLLQNGYEHMRLTDGPGQFARRGDIIDVVLPSAEDGQPGRGIRLSFFDQEIDAIKLFDPDTQRSSTMLDKIELPPVREVLPDWKEKDRLAENILQAGRQAVRQARANAAEAEPLAQMERMTRHDAERVDNRMHFAALDRWLGLIYPDAAGVLDYALQAETCFFIEEPLRLSQRIDAAQAEMDERIRQMISRGQAISETIDVVFRSVDFVRWLEKMRPAVALCQIAASGNTLPDAHAVFLQARPSDGYRGRETQLMQDIKKWTDESWQVWLFAGSDNRRQRLEQLCLDHQVQARILVAAMPRGFIWPEAGMAVVGTHDIFGSERPSRRRRREGGIKIDLFSDLVPGELVVHEAHGIGRYEGLVNMASNGSRRDYLKLVYAGDDALYIPMESLDQIQKYVGADARIPKLSKLGGQEWNRLKERAKSSIRKLATDLIRLYAERSARKGYRFSADTIWQLEFEEQFPFEETEDQLRSIREIKQDMESEKVMDRLLCGDVGFGKTEVAFRAIFKCVMDGRQAIMLAPTTVLAQQHFENIRQRMAGFPIQTGLLSRFASEAMQKNTLNGLMHGKIDVAVGTHRLLSQDVRLKNLGLLIIDEEQRFGVDHKEKLKTLWPDVDVLTLSATPIPRTLHMAMSGIRDISVLEEPPHDRRPVQTYVMEFDQAIVAEAILRELSRGGQVFYLYNDTRRIMEKAAALEQLLPGARIAIAHGKMTERSLEDVINAFIAQESDILVCTTIIESGIDMPNVNTIVVENADHLGLAQLYQLRGRVGRSDRQAYAYVTYRRDKVLSEIAEKRLAAIRDFTELGAGFKIALRDLEVRGAGNLLGAEQHGQLDAIGYDLYCRMLEETVRELQGQARPAPIATVVDLDVDAFIERTYIPDEGQRMDVYRRMANIGSLADYQDVLDECLDRYGEMPPTALALADIAYARNAASRFGFKSITQQQQNILLSYDESVQPDMGVLSRLISRPALKGRILFNAGTRPYLVYRQAAVNKREINSQLRQLFITMETEEQPDVYKKRVGS